MDITKFNEKFNKLDGNIYTVEETVAPVNGVYEAELEHDNINLTALNVYTGSKLTGDKINTYVTSTPSLTPWKTAIKIFSDISPVYISYETTGDTVEADDINNVQGAIVDTQKALNDEITRAENAEKVLTDNLSNEINRAKTSENTITNNLNGEISRAKSAENTLTTNLANEINRASSIENNIINTINTNTPIWNDKYTKNEIDNKFNIYTTNLDWKESVETYADIVKTYPNSQDGWTVNVKDTDITYRYDGSGWIPISANSIPLATKDVDGKMSKQDKIDHDDMVSKRHTHSNKTIIDIITQSLIDNWNAAFTHISDAVKHITSNERSNWNTAYTNNHTHSNKSVIDGITSTLIGYWNSAYNHISDMVRHITSSERTQWNTVSDKLDKSGGSMIGALTIIGAASDNRLVTRGIQGSDGNGATGELYLNQGNDNPVFINGNKVYHAGNKPNKSDVGLPNVDNTSDSNKPISNATQNALNGKSDNGHTHDDRYYTETECNSKFATKSEISSAGYGDMLKSVYDSNNNGIVDKAEKLATIRKINGVDFDGSNDINLTPENLGANKWTCMYKHGASSVLNYSRILALTITGTYADINECFIISCRSNRIAFAMLTGSCGNDYKANNLKVDIFPLTTNAYSIVNYFRAGIITVSSTVDGIELWMKVNAWDDCQIYPQTSMRRGYSIAYYNGTTNTSFPSFSSYVDSQLLAIKATQDSDGKQINTTYVKKAMTWNDLEGV